MKSKRALIFSAVLGFLILGLASQFLFALGRVPSPAKMPVAVIPDTVTGAKIEDLQIAGTESLSRAIEEGLGFSDYRYREYTQGGVTFSIYLAYWQDRRRHYMDLGTHAPDNCWVSNGWKMDAKLPKQAFIVHGDDSLASIETWPAENRIFHAGSTTLYVAYWHLVAGHPLDYTRYGTGKTVGYLLDNISFYLKGTSEQHFLRIASNVPLIELEKSSVFQTVMASLVKDTPLARH